MEANELYGICERLVSGEPSPQSRRELHEVLSLTVAHGCSGERGAYGNLFSQTDILCRRIGICDTDRLEIQTARRNCSAGNSHASAAAAEDDWPYDVRAVSTLVSAVFREAMPGSLRRLLPSAPRQRLKGLRINKRYVRCIVRRHDDNTIWADTGEGEVAVDYGTTEQGRDFAYLRKCLRPGMQLNLLDCNLSDNASQPSALITPAIIILEPDFLIDISSLAACFTAYGHHPLLYTLNRIKPRPNTQATLLGNFAGVALDMTVSRSHDASAGGRVPPDGKEDLFSAALKRTFREDTLRYLACADYDPVKFRQEAERQTHNIAEAVDILKCEAKGHGGFLLEPSFVCEQLGLQGRVDLMTTDMSLLVEQKSGKNMKIEYQSHDSHGLQLESHYVQLLLYYATLRYNFQRGDRQVDTRLLYSRYAPGQGLLAVNYYRTLLREALKLRNQIVATELLIARDGFQRILPLLNADVIYNNVARDGYFHRYVLPGLQALDSRVSSLTPLERTYLERMMTFVYREQVAARLGSSEQRLHHVSGAASDLWLMPLSEKVETGNIFIGLNISSIERSDPDAGYDRIILVPSASAVLPCSNFRRGDMVCLHQYDGEPDVRRAILYNGTLDEITDGRLTVLLNYGQQNDSVFNNDRPWALEHGGSDASTSGSIRSLFQFAAADPQRRALLLGQRPPQADPLRRLSRSYNLHYDDILLRIRQSRDYFLLVGPPGTGKTSMALRFIVEEELNSSGDAAEGTVLGVTAKPGASLLLTAYTNRAVDEICDMLEDAGQDYLRLGNAASCDPRFRHRLISEMAAGVSSRTSGATDSPSAAHYAMHALIKRTPVIVSTTSMLLARPFIFDLKHFSLAVVDEASQILEPGLIGILASDRIDRFVLIGDHKQLPAVVQQDGLDAAIAEQPLRDIGITDARQSLFQRLYQWELRQGRRQFVGTLTRQGRMHPDVASFPSSHFYGGRLLPVPIAHQTAATLGYDMTAEDSLDQLLKERRMLFLHSRHTDEARMVADILRRIRRFCADRFDPRRTVGVIVPYRSQISAIHAEMETMGLHDMKDITIDTVERYQGSQRDVIVYSFAVDRLYQLDFLTASTYSDENGNTVDRKLNVALTRARKQMIMVGDADILCHNDLFRKLIKTYRP